MPSLAGPKRPQDRINLDNVKSTFTGLFSAPVKENGFAKRVDDLERTYKTFDGTPIKNGDVLIAAITSCTNTSNPGVLLAAGLLAKKAVERRAARAADRGSDRQERPGVRGGALRKPQLRGAHPP
jgi:aconitate hydratase